MKWHKIIILIGFQAEPYNDAPIKLKLLENGEQNVRCMLCKIALRTKMPWQFAKKRCIVNNIYCRHSLWTHHFGWVKVNIFYPKMDKYRSSALAMHRIIQFIRRCVDGGKIWNMVRAEFLTLTLYNIYKYFNIECLWWILKTQKIAHWNGERK